MTSRRSFLKGFAALATGIALAPATALRDIQRLGTPQDWVTPNGGPFTFTAVRSGRWHDPSTWDRGAVPGEESTVVIGAGRTVEIAGAAVVGTAQVDGARIVLTESPLRIVRGGRILNSHIVLPPIADTALSLSPNLDGLYIGRCVLFPRQPLQHGALG